MPTGNERYGPALVLLSGLPGSGKTTFARAAASRYGAVHLESDAIRREIFPQPKYSYAESRIVFREMERRAARALVSGNLVVADATNLLEEHRARFHGIAARLRVPLLTVRLTAPPKAVIERLRNPREGLSQAGPAVYEEMRSTVERPLRPSLVIDSRYSTEPALHALGRLLEESG